MKKWKVLLGIGILILFGLIGSLSSQKNTQHTTSSVTPTPSSKVESTPTSLPTVPLDVLSTKDSLTPQTFLVTRVVDGDTIEIEGGKTVRYIGINTPETVDPRRPIQCFGTEASSKNKELVIGKRVRLEKDISETDKYGGLLRYVWIDDTFINEYLVRQGYAHASAYPPDITKQQVLQEAQQEAQEQGRGLWSQCSGSGDIKPVVPTPIPGCNIKGNINGSGEKIYHLPGCGSYDKTSIDATRGEQMFCSEEEAQSAGWRKAGNC